MVLQFGDNRPMGMLSNLRQIVLPYRILHRVFIPLTKLLMQYTVKCGPTVAVINNTACLVRQVGQLVYDISAELEDLIFSALT